MRSKIEDLHPGRFDCTCLDTNSEEKQVFYTALRSRIRNAKEVEIHVELDKEDRTRSISLRRHLIHRAKYADYFQDFQSRVRYLDLGQNSAFDMQRIKICENHKRCRPSKVRYNRSSASNPPRSPPSDDAFPRIGAFEVLILWRDDAAAPDAWASVLVSSKLHDMAWPNLDWLVARVTWLLSDGAPPPLDSDDGPAGRQDKSAGRTAWADGGPGFRENFPPLPPSPEQAAESARTDCEDGGGGATQRAERLARHLERARADLRRAEREAVAREAEAAGLREALSAARRDAAGLADELRAERLAREEADRLARVQAEVRERQVLAAQVTATLGVCVRTRACARVCRCRCRCRCWCWCWCVCVCV
jgi:hypothetical protein